MYLISSKGVTFSEDPLENGVRKSRKEKPRGNPGRYFLKKVVEKKVVEKGDIKEKDQRSL